MMLGRRIALAALVFAVTTNSRAEPLRILTTEVPPLAFIKDGKISGFCVEIVDEIQRRLGRDFSIEVLPWARAYRLAQEGRNTVLVCPKRSLEREQLFHWVGPLLTAKTAIYTKAESHLTLHRLEDAKQLSTILVLRESYSHHHLSANGFQNLYPVKDPKSMLHMLTADRAPAMVLESIQLDALLREEAIPKSTVVPILTVQSPSSFLAFSLDVPDTIVKQWQATLDSIKKDGSYSRIHEKWFSVSNGSNKP
ncbi:substrate-binding periplasmic protein [Duganella sp. PWIR1]